MLDEVFEFAIKAHKGAYRKGTKTPYILHPIETAAIAARITNDTDVIAGAVLHDTIEDTNVTYNELKNIFGELIADIVKSVSEDKSKSWEERKSHTLNTLENESIEVKIVVLSDKLSNMRSIYNDYSATIKIMCELQGVNISVPQNATLSAKIAYIQDVYDGSKQSLVKLSKLCGLSENYIFRMYRKKHKNI